MTPLRARVEASVEEVGAGHLCRQLICKTGKYDHLDLLLSWQQSDEVTQEQLRALLLFWWPGVTWLSDRREEVVALFRYVGFATDDFQLEPPTRPLTLLRGIGPWGQPRGLSWTTSKASATWFALSSLNAVARNARGRRRSAMMNDCAGMLLEADVPPERVLAILHQRKEEEIVVDPNENGPHSFEVRVKMMLPGRGRIQIDPSHVGDHDAFVDNFGRYHITEEEIRPK